MSAPIERFTSGERFAVDPDAIERELAAAWRVAGKSTEAGRPVTRACLWNVVFHVEGRHEEGRQESARLERTVKDLPRHLAARAVILRTHGEEERAEGDEGEDSSRLRSYISANCVLAAGGGKLVCSEEISLEAWGQGVTHLPALARALLVPEVPTAVVFGTVPEEGDPLVSALLDLADRIVIRASRCRLPEPFRLARELGAGRSFADLGWVEQAELRRAVAAVFDGSEGDVDKLTSVEAHVGPGCRGDAALALGWIADRLRASEVLERAEGRTRVRTSHGDIDLVMKAREDERGIALCFLGEGVDRCVHQEAGGGLRLERPSGPRRRHGLEGGEAALLARALLSRSEDPELLAALRWAREIAR